jgi:RimJ/RimL family protein N-acetyltransferase
MYKWPNQNFAPNLESAALIRDSVGRISVQRRATTSIRVDEGMILRPAQTIHSNALIEAFMETWPEVSRAMPWIIPDQPMEPQIIDFLEETERMGRTGYLHHWAIIRPWDESLIGLIGFDKITRSAEADWNLGYWIRSSEQRRGHAQKAIDAVLDWMSQSGTVVVELKVDPLNTAGLKTVNRTVRKWKGSRCVTGDSSITVSGTRTTHQCYTIPISDRN